NIEIFGCNRKVSSSILNSSPSRKGTADSSPHSKKGVIMHHRAGITKPQTQLFKQHRKGTKTSLASSPYPAAMHQKEKGESLQQRFHEDKAGFNEN
ncbi:unnamed protein product, partial [Musa acuminata var. zebrina]